MFSDDMLRRCAVTPVDMPNAAWLAGAAAGLGLVGTRSPQWLWDPFISDVKELVEISGDLTPAQPGTSPDVGDGSIGSAYDALGGYVSVVAEMCPEGLYFRVPTDCQAGVLCLLSSFDVRISAGEIVLSQSDIQAFARLVPIHGPLSDSFAEEELI
jgi:hypothetical protein